MQRLLSFLTGLLLLVQQRLSAGSHGVFLRFQRRYLGISFVSGWHVFRMIPVIAGGTEAIATTGAYVEVGDPSTSPPTMTEIGEVVTIGGPNPDSEELDATHLRSPARTREYLQSFLVPGEMPLTVNFIPGSASHQLLLSLYASGETVPVTLNYPDGSTDTMDAYVKNRPTSMNVGEVLRMQFTLRVTGQVVFTPAT